LRDHLHSSLDGVDGWSNNTRWSQDESAAIQRYVTLLSELLGLLRKIGQQWQDQLDAQILSSSYHVASVSTGTRGEGQDLT